MAKGAFRTPVYLFGSTRSGAGKSTLLANVAVYSHSRGLRIAIIDLNHAFPLQIRNSLPRSLTLETYADLSEISQQISPRFRRSFYFTNVDRLSYFPAFKIPSPLSLLQDTSYRDFFLQLRGSFDQVFINLSPGINEFSCLETFASRRTSRDSFSLLGVLVTTADVRSLHLFDQLWRDRPAIQYLLTNQLLVVFNRVQANLEDQTLASTFLSTSEIRSIFRLPMSTSIPAIKDFTYQGATPGALVLDEKSPTRGPISRLTRILADAAEGHPPFDPESEDLFHPCLNSERLSRYSRFLPQIQSIAARRLFIPIHGVTVYLEECGTQIRLRLRFTRRARPTFSRSLGMPPFQTGEITGWSMPTPLPWVTTVKPSSVSFCWKERPPQPVVQAVYQFDDRFSHSTDFWPKFHSEFRQDFPCYPPIERFRQSFRIAGIMGLLESLGYGNLLGKACELISPASESFGFALFRPEKIKVLALNDTLQPLVSFPMLVQQSLSSRPAIAPPRTPASVKLVLFEKALLPPKEEVSSLFLRRWKLEADFNIILSSHREPVPGPVVCRSPILSFSKARPSAPVFARPNFSPSGLLTMGSKTHVSLTGVAYRRNLHNAQLTPLLAPPIERLYSSFLTFFRPVRAYKFHQPTSETIGFGRQALSIKFYPVSAPPVEANHVSASLPTTFSSVRAVRFAEFFLEKQPWAKTPSVPDFLLPTPPQVRTRFGVDPVLLSYRFFFKLVGEDSGFASMVFRKHSYFDDWKFRWPETLQSCLTRVETLSTTASLSRPRYSQIFGAIGERLREQPFTSDWPRNHRLRAIFQSSARFSLHRAFIGSQRGLSTPFSVLFQQLERPVLTRKALKTMIGTEKRELQPDLVPRVVQFDSFQVRNSSSPTPKLIFTATPLPGIQQVRPGLISILKPGLSRKGLETKLPQILNSASRFLPTGLPAGCGAYFGYTPREEWFHLNLAGFVLLVSDCVGIESLAHVSCTQLQLPSYQFPEATSCRTFPFAPKVPHRSFIPFHQTLTELPLVRPASPMFGIESEGDFSISSPDGLMNCPLPIFPSPDLFLREPDLRKTFFRLPAFYPLLSRKRAQLPDAGNTTIAFLFFVLSDKLKRHLLKLEVSDHNRQKLFCVKKPGKPHRPKSELRLSAPNLQHADLAPPKRLNFSSNRFLRIQMARLSSLMESAQSLNALVPPAAS